MRIRKQIKIFLTPTAHKRFKSFADMNAMNMAKMIRIAIREFYKIDLDLK